MASFRKKHQDRVELSDKGPAVAATPQLGAAKLPDPVTEQRPAEPLETKDPVRDAEQNALRDRLREMESAENTVREAAQQQQRFAQERQQQPDPLETFLNSIPKVSADWLR